MSPLQGSTKSFPTPTRAVTPGYYISRFEREREAEPSLTVGLLPRWSYCRDYPVATARGTDLFCQAGYWQFALNADRMSALRSQLLSYEQFICFQVTSGSRGGHFGR